MLAQNRGASLPASSTGGFVDLHAHVLPGLDDGPQNWEESLAVLEAAAAGGTTALVATPHWLEGGYAPQVGRVLEAAAELGLRAAARGINVAVRPGMEVYLSPDVPRHLSAGKLLTIADTGAYLLLELPFEAWPPYAERVVFELQLAGITPVLAHPERCREAAADPRRIRTLAERGVLVQINAGSLTGRFGRTSQRCVYHLIGTGCAHFAASDAHNARDRSPDLSAAYAAAANAFGEDCARALFCENPAAILSGCPVTPAVPDPGAAARTKGFGPKSAIKRFMGFFG